MALPYEELAPKCLSRLRPEPLRRQGTRLNIETSTGDSVRCVNLSPDGRGLDWWLSGGDIRDYGYCQKAACPLAAADAAEEEISAKAKTRAGTKN